MAPTEAISFSNMRRQAEQGSAGAQFILGTLYEFGPCLPQDYQESVCWLHKAADQGHARAQHIVGRDESPVKESELWQMK